MRTPNAFRGRLQGWGGKTAVWMVVAITLCASVTLRPAIAADPQAVARKHSRKAAQLAAANKCRAAIEEYSKALAVLKDPALFFNRGECYRRIGDNGRALADYRLFLLEVPDAPNRATVAARIAELEPVAVKAPAAPRVEPGEHLTAPAAPASEPALLAPERPAPLSMGEGSINTAPEPKFADPQIVMVGNEPPPPDKEADSGIAGRWWFWTALGAVLIGGGVAGYFILNPAKTEVPSTHLGNYPF
jgi:tetratricopeptide (TPR) repeat protein